MRWKITRIHCTGPPKCAWRQLIGPLGHFAALPGGGPYSARGAVSRSATSASQPLGEYGAGGSTSMPNPGMIGAFSIVSFAEPGALDVVHMDVPSSTLWLESEEDAARHSRIFDRIA